MAQPTSTQKFSTAPWYGTPLALGLHRMRISAACPQVLGMRDPGVRGSGHTRGMSTIIHATEPADLLGIVPALAGFTPRRSIVMLPFHGTRAHGAMRVDLPDADVDPDDFADAAVHALLQVDGIDAVAIVVYTDEHPQPIPDGVLLPRLTVTEALADVAEEAGLHVVDALCVTPDGWADYRDDDPDVRPLSSIRDVSDVPGLGVVTGDQTAGARLPSADLAGRERVGRALRELEGLLAARREGGTAPKAGESPMALERAGMLLEDLPRFAEAVIGRSGDLPPYDCAALLWCLSRPMLRDALLVQWATDHDFGCLALQAQLEFAGPRSEIPDAVGQVFLGRGTRPDPDRLGCALEVVRQAASLAPRDAKAGALTAAAWLAWALGRSSHAGQYVDQALQIEPEHGMASLISTMLAAALLPEWVLRRA